VLTILAQQQINLLHCPKSWLRFCIALNELKKYNN
jgi:hypothetical protein